MSDQSTHTTAAPGRPEIEIAVPASSAYLSVLRTAAAGLAARLHFTLDEIEDLRIAVDEGCAIILAQAAPDSELRCSFDLTTDAVVVSASVTSPEVHEPARDTFAWTVLIALASSVEVVLDPPRLSITLEFSGPKAGGR